MLNTIFSILIGLLGISVMVLVHEFGHFICARLFGVDVTVVSFGFGPAIFKWGKKRTYQIAALPFGGYCKMKGDEDLRKALARKDKSLVEAQKGSLYSISPKKRLLIYLNGPLFNLLFSVLCLFIIFNIPSLSAFSEPKIVLASDYPTLFSEINPSAKEAGLKSGMIIESVDSHPISSYQQMVSLLKDKDEAVLVSNNEEFKIKALNGKFGLGEFIKPVVQNVGSNIPLKKGDLLLSLNDYPLTNMLDILLVMNSNPPILNFIVNRNGKIVQVGYKNPGSVNFTLHCEGKLVRTHSLYGALKEAIIQTVNVFNSCWDNLFNLFRGKTKVKETVSGTLAASNSIGEVTKKGFNQSFVNGVKTILYLLSGVSTSIAIANLLPIPSLDGGLMMLSLAEAINGKNASPRVYIICQIVGFVLVMLLMILLNFG